MQGAPITSFLLAILTLSLAACDSKWTSSDVSEVDSFSDTVDSPMDFDSDDLIADVPADEERECSPSTECNERVNSDGLAVAQLSPTLAVGPGCVLYVAWQDYRNDDGGFYDDYDIYFASSTNGGLSWRHPNIKVSTGTMGMDQRNPTLAVSPDGDIYLAWQDRRTLQHDIYFASSRDGGSTWTDPNIMINSDSSAEDQKVPAIAVDPAGIVYVAWEDNREDPSAIYIARSINGGETWTDPNVKITTRSSLVGESNPDIAVDEDGVVYAVWEDAREVVLQIYFARSDDGGRTWSDPSVKVTPWEMGDNQHFPAIAVGPEGNIYVVLQDGRFGDSDIYFSRSTDGGDAWSPEEIRINTDGVADTNQTDPDIAVDLSGTIHVTWEDHRETVGDIYHAVSSDNGLTWTDPNTLITTDSSDSEQGKPQIALDSHANAYLVWEDSRMEDPDIYFCSLPAGE
jgi:hypothetical protein